MRFTSIALLFASACAPLAFAQPTQAADADFTRCLDQLRAPARAAKVQDEAFSRFTQGLQPDMSVIVKLNYQPEFKLPIWDYLAALVDDERVADGQARLAAQAEVLRAVEQRHGVDPATVVAVWGVESNFGQGLGGLPILRSLRSEEHTSELQSQR